MHRWMDAQNGKSTDKKNYFPLQTVRCNDSVHTEYIWGQPTKQYTEMIDIKKRIDFGAGYAAEPPREHRYEN